MPMISGTDIVSCQLDNTEGTAVDLMPHLVGADPQLTFGRQPNTRFNSKANREYLTKETQQITLTLKPDTELIPVFYNTDAGKVRSARTFELEVGDGTGTGTVGFKISGEALVVDRPAFSVLSDGSTPDVTAMLGPGDDEGFTVSAVISR